MTPERIKQLVALRKERDRLEVIFKEARDNWTKACSDLNYELLKELDYYHYIRGIKKQVPEWLSEVKDMKPAKGVVTKQKINLMVEEMLKKSSQSKKREAKHDSSWKSLW